MPAPADPRKITLFERHLIGGATIREAAMRAGIGESWGYKHASVMRNHGRIASAEHHKAAKLGGPIPFKDLRPEAVRALSDFTYFRRRYLGNVSDPWQEQAAQVMAAAWESERREFVVENCPPGGGKTFLAGDFALWLTCKHRRLRGLIGSGTQAKASKMLGRIRRELERAVPLRAPDDLVALGVACNAEATLTGDYGLFKPPDREDPWRSDALIVVQDHFESITEKEHTWSAYGLEVDYLGDRIDVAIWDDAVVPKDLTSLEKIESLRKNFDTISESRLEPGGALFLIGQRIGANDLYAHCLAKKILPDDDDDLDALEAMDDNTREEAMDRLDRKYTHIVYPAHDETRCTNQHDRTSPPWPAGCLLSPRRLPWKGPEGLRNIRYENREIYETWYQQQDTDPTDTLIRKVWVNGGTDPVDHTIHYPAWDTERGIGDPLPAGIAGPLFSYATVDPSPTRYWGIQWWVAAPNASNQLFLMDLEKRRLRADEVLEWNANLGVFTGLMQDWQTRSHAMGLPIRTWVVEKNGAQRFMLQYEFVRRWIAEHRTAILPHETTMRKNDPEYGVYTLREFWRHGRVRLPGKPGHSRLQSMKLTDECEKYPHGYQDDQVMAMWFGTSHLDQLTIQSGANVALRRPSWSTDGMDARHLMAVK